MGCEHDLLVERSLEGAAGMMRARSWEVGGSAVGLVQALSVRWEEPGSVAALGGCLVMVVEGMRHLLEVYVAVVGEGSNLQR